MNGRDFIRQPFIIQQKIDVISRQIEDSREAAEKITSELSDDVVSRTRNVHSMEDKIVNIVALQARLDSLKDQLQASVYSVRCVIDAVYPEDDMHNLVLKSRHLRFNPWTAIAIRTDMTERRVLQMNDEAISAIDRWLDDNGKSYDIN